MQSSRQPGSVLRAWPVVQEPQHHQLSGLATLHSQAERYLRRSKPDYTLLYGSKTYNLWDLGNTCNLLSVAMNTTAVSLNTPRPCRMEIQWDMPYVLDISYSNKRFKLIHPSRDPVIKYIPGIINEGIFQAKCQAHFPYIRDSVFSNSSPTTIRSSFSSTLDLELRTSTILMAKFSGVSTRRTVMFSSLLLCNSETSMG